MTEDLRKNVSKIAKKLDLAAIPTNWTGVDFVWPILERMKCEGAVIVLKIDGARDSPKDSGQYTFMVSGGPLKGEFIRIDTAALDYGLAYIITEYAKHCWFKSSP